MWLRLRNVGGKKKMFVLSSSFRVPDHCLCFKSPRLLSPQGPQTSFSSGTPDFLSTCLGIDSLTLLPSPDPGLMLGQWKLLSRVQLFAIPWALQSMEFSRPEYWSGYPFPSPGDLPNPGIEPRSPWCIAGRFLTTWAIREALDVRSAE